MTEDGPSQGGAAAGESPILVGGAIRRGATGSTVPRRGSERMATHPA